MRDMYTGGRALCRGSFDVDHPQQRSQEQQLVLKNDKPPEFDGAAAMCFTEMHLHLVLGLEGVADGMCTSTGVDGGLGGGVSRGTRVSQQGDRRRRQRRRGRVAGAGAGGAGVAGRGGGGRVGGADAGRGGRSARGMMWIRDNAASTHSTSGGRGGNSGGGVGDMYGSGMEWIANSRRPDVTAGMPGRGGGGRGGGAGGGLGIGGGRSGGGGGRGIGGGRGGGVGRGSGGGGDGNYVVTWVRNRHAPDNDIELDLEGLRGSSPGASDATSMQPQSQRHQVTRAHTRSMGTMPRVPVALAIIAQAEDFAAYTAEHQQRFRQPDLPTYVPGRRTRPASSGRRDDIDTWFWVEDTEFDGLLAARTFTLVESS